MKLIFIKFVPNDCFLCSVVEFQLEEMNLAVTLYIYIGNKIWNSLHLIWKKIIIFIILTNYMMSNELL